MPRLTYRIDSKTSDPVLQASRQAAQCHSAKSFEVLTVRRAENLSGFKWIQKSFLLLKCPKLVPSPITGGCERSARSRSEHGSDVPQHDMWRADRAFPSVFGS